MTIVKKKKEMTAKAIAVAAAMAVEINQQIIFEQTKKKRINFWEKKNLQTFNIKIYKARRKNFFQNYFDIF